MFPLYLTQIPIQRAKLCKIYLQQYRLMEVLLISGLPLHLSLSVHHCFCWQDYLTCKKVGNCCVFQNPTQQTKWNRKAFSHKQQIKYASFLQFLWTFYKTKPRAMEFKKKLVGLYVMTIFNGFTLNPTSTVLIQPGTNGPTRTIAKNDTKSRVASSQQNPTTNLHMK